MRAELAVRPFYVVDAQAVAMTGMRVGIVEHGGPQIGVVDNLGVLHADSLENLLASEDGMGAGAVDVEGRDVEARLVAGILRGAIADAAGGRLSRRAWSREGDTWREVSGRQNETTGVMEA